MVWNLVFGGLAVLLLVWVLPGWLMTHGRTAPHARAVAAMLAGFVIWIVLLAASPDEVLAAMLLIAGALVVLPLVVLFLGGIAAFAGLWTALALMACGLIAGVVLSRHQRGRIKMVLLAAAAGPLFEVSLAAQDAVSGPVIHAKAQERGLEIVSARTLRQTAHDRPSLLDIGVDGLPNAHASARDAQGALWIWSYSQRDWVRYRDRTERAHR